MIRHQGLARQSNEAPRAQALRCFAAKHPSSVALHLPGVRVAMGDANASSDSSSSEDERAKKKAEKKKSKVDKKAKKKDKKKSKGAEKDKKVKTKDKKRKASSSSSESASSKQAKKSSKKQKSGHWGNDKVQEAWINARQKAIRKEDPNVPKDDALKQAIGEYLTIFSKDVTGVEAPGVASAEFSDHRFASLAVPRDGPVADAVAQAELEAREAARAKGQTKEQVEEAALEARAIVLRAARESGLYAEPERETLFEEQIKNEQAEERRYNAMAPLVNDSETQLARNAAARVRQ